jgi:hypothetical protein
MAVSVKAVAAAMLDVLDVLEGRTARIDPAAAAAHRENLGATDDQGAPEPGPADGE